MILLIRKKFKCDDESKPLPKRRDITKFHVYFYMYPLMSISAYLPLQAAFFSRSRAPSPRIRARKID